MVVRQFQIYLDNEWAVYYAGQTVTGRVELILDSPKTVRGVTIEFKGQAQTQWSVVRKNEKRRTIPASMGATQRYFKLRWPLIGTESGSQVEIPKGTHVFPFSYTLPLTLPSSFEGEFGYIMYTCKANIHRPWKSDQEAKAALTVLSVVDLNTIERCHAPVTRTKDKYFCCRSGPLTCTVALPCTGYVPGQTISVSVNVHNASNVDVHAVYVFIMKTVTFRREHTQKTKETTDKLIKQKLEGVKAHSYANYNVQLNLPTETPFGLDCCSLIDLDYVLHTEVKVSGLHRNLTGRIPLVIGTVPIVQEPTPVAHSAPIDAESESTLLLEGNDEI